MAQARRASGLIAAVVLAVVPVACGSGEPTLTAPSPLREPNPSSGCNDVIKYPNEGTQHIGVDQKGSYKTHPPTSGSHWASANPPGPAPTGLHANEVPDEAQVHNLEHGHMLIQYLPGEIDKALLDALVGFVRKNPQWIMLAPRAAARFDPPAALAFTAWTISQICPSPGPADAVLDDARVFFEAYARTAPEKVPGQTLRQTPPTA